jgi:hypothetical protein
MLAPLCFGNKNNEPASPVAENASTVKHEAGNPNQNTCTNYEYRSPKQWQNMLDSAHHYAFRY